MTSKKAIYILLGLIVAYVVIRFVVGLFQDAPSNGDASPGIGFTGPIDFPICRNANKKQEVVVIQGYLNKNMQGYVKAPLVEDGIFGGLTESELQAQTGSICVSSAMFQGML